MADALTHSNLDNFGTAQVGTVLNLVLQWFTKDQPEFKNYAMPWTPSNVPYPGETVTAHIAGKLPENTTPLDELVDPDAVPMPDLRPVSVTVQEYGSPVNATKRLRLTSFTGTVLKDIAYTLGENGLESVDKIYQTQLDGASNVIYVADAGLTRTDPTTTIAPFTANAATAAVAQLRNRRASRYDGVNYLAVVHPDVSADIRTESGSAWVAAHTYQDTAELYAGEIGSFSGARFIENPRATATAGVYTSYFLGQESLFHVEVEPMHLIVGPQVDKMLRFHPVSWYAFFGVTRFRENSIELVKSESTFGSLTAAWDPTA